MDTLLLDLRYAVRKLFKSPGFTGVAVLTLALAIGATTAIFSVINGVLLKPLPFRDPERVVRVTSTSRDGKRSPVSAVDFVDWRAQTKSFAGFSAIDVETVNLTAPSVDPERLTSANVGANFFSLLGVTPAQGRGFAPKEDEPGAARVAVLSDAFWRRRFAANPRVVGQTITLDGQAVTVVGVAPKGFDYPRQPDVWRPLVFEGWMIDPANRGAHWLGVIARLADGATLDQADAEMMQLAKRLERQFPESNTGFHADVVPVHEFTVGDVRDTLYVMLGAVAFVLLIACANVANLLLVRATTRETEMAVRAALGAGRGRIVRQLVTESVVLAAAGGAAGTVLALWGVDFLVRAAPANLPRVGEIAVDGRVLGFTALVAAGTGLLFGLIPALHTYRANVGGMLRDATRGLSARRGSNRVRGALVMAETALAVVLLVGAGLLIRSFANLVAVDPGFRAERVVNFNVAAPATKYARISERRALLDEIRTRVGAIPGVQSVAVVTGRPLGNINSRTSVQIVGTPVDPPASRKLTGVAFVTPGYFATLGIPVSRGREFDGRERSGTPMVAVVNREFVRRYFPNEDPIGKRIELGWTQDTSDVAERADATLGGEIIGVVGDVKQHGLSAEVLPATFVSMNQVPMDEFSVLVRATRDPSSVITGVRSQLRQIDPDLPLYEIKELGEIVSDSVAQPRFYMALLAAFAGIALVLAAIGIYGVISYSVSQRQRELGIRIALGATRRHVMRLVIGHGMLLTAAGAAVGVVGALWATELLAALLFGVGMLDTLTFTAVTGALLAIAALACYLPARRATKVDPVITMREA